MRDRSDMNTSSAASEKRRVIITAMFVLVAFIVLSAGYTLFFNREINKSREHYQLIAHNEMAYIATTVENIMARTAALRALVQEHGDDPKFFYTAAEEIFLTVRDETGITLKNVAIAPEGVVTSVYPLSGNESLLGFNFLDASREGNLQAKEAYDKGETILTNPFELMQGDLGMIIKRKRAEQEERRKDNKDIAEIDRTQEELQEYRDSRRRSTEAR